MACPLGVRINRVPLYTNRRQEKTETKDFYNPRTESRIGYNFVTFGFAFLTATFFSGYFSCDFFILVILCFHTATNRVAPSSPLYIWDKPDNNTSICSDKGLAFEISTYNLFYVQVKPAKIYTLYQPSHGRKPPGRPQKSFFSQVQECTDPRISKRLTSCALPKTEPVGDDLQSSALWSTDDDVSINSLFIVPYFSV